ncbi:MAG: hypothetical protein IPJ41_16785 [Phycisphaerales bacterium]|nr:hypothetical protein [Phycisphaerales bacterium]
MHLDAVPRMPGVPDGPNASGVVSVSWGCTTWIAIIRASATGSSMARLSRGPSIGSSAASASVGSFVRTTALRERPLASDIAIRLPPSRASAAGISTHDLFAASRPEVLWASVIPQIGRPPKDETLRAT